MASEAGAPAAIAEHFEQHGWAIAAVEDTDALSRIYLALCDEASRFVGARQADEVGDLLNRLHDEVEVERLNELRLRCIEALNRPELRADYLALARSAIEAVVGNELAVQRRLNLSIQMPGDESSLLPAHADTWAGDSPYEVVLWTPLVDCAGTKSMFMQDGDRRWFFDMHYGQFLLFTPTLVHGNEVNRTDETRWSINCRVKSLMSPFAAKLLGEFFEPVDVKPATRVGLRYRLPEVI